MLNGCILNDRHNNQLRQLQYRQILDNQIRQKQLLKMHKERTQKQKLKAQLQAQILASNHMQAKYQPSLPIPPKRLSMVAISFDPLHYPPRILQDINKCKSKEKKMIQKSVFFPSVHQNYDNSRMYEFPGSKQSRVSYYSIDPQAQTMETLAECELIIQNLKKLTHRSAKKVMQICNKKRREEVDNECREALFFKSLQSSADHEVQVFRTIEPYGNPKKRSTDNLRNVNKQKLRPGGLCIQNKLIRSQQIPNEQRDSKNKSSNKSNISNISKRSQRSQRGDSTTDKQKDINEEQLQKQKQKQKHILKYLAKAKLRGVKLHEKLLGYKNKHSIMKQSIQSNLSQQFHKSGQRSEAQQLYSNQSGISTKQKQSKWKNQQ